MRDIEWLLSGGRNGDDFVRLAESFEKPDQKSGERAKELGVVERFQTERHGDDFWEEMALKLREELVDFSVQRFLAKSGLAPAHQDLWDLEERMRAVIEADRRGLVVAILEEIGDPQGQIFPLRALYLRWRDGRRGVMLLSVGTSDEWAVSVAVTPYLEYFERENPVDGRFPILERRFKEIPGDGSLLSSLKLALSGDLEGLEEMGFVDRASVLRVTSAERR